MDEQEIKEANEELEAERRIVASKLMDTLESYTEQIKNSQDMLVKKRGKDFVRDHQYTFPMWVINVLSQQTMMINSLNRLLANCIEDGETEENKNEDI